MRFTAFPVRVGPRILSLERVDNFGRGELFSGRKKNTSSAKADRSGDVNLYCMQMSLVMSMRFIFSGD